MEIKIGILTKILKKLFSIFHKKKIKKIPSKNKKKLKEVLVKAEDFEADKILKKEIEEIQSTKQEKLKVENFEMEALSELENIFFEEKENINPKEKDITIVNSLVISKLNLELEKKIIDQLKITSIEKVKFEEVNNLEPSKEIELKETIKKEPKIIKRKISGDLLIQNILSEEEMKIFGEKLGSILKFRNIDSRFSPEIVTFLVSVAYYEGFSSGGYWNKVFNILRIKYSQSKYLHLTEILKETLQHKHLFIDNGTQWAYNTIMAHTIVPLEEGAFYKYLDFVYSFYDSIESDVTSVPEDELKLMIEELLKAEKESSFILKGTKLAIENCLKIVVEYFIEILYFIDILDSQKEDISNLGKVIKEKITYWYDLNLNKGFSLKKIDSINFFENSKEENETISITNRIGSLKFTCDKDGVNIETPKISFDYPIDEIFIKIGEYKAILNCKKIGNKFIVKPRLFTRKTFDFKLIKLFINGELIKEWNNKIVFFKESGKNIKPKESKNNIYELDIKKIRILFDSSYSIISTSKENKEISETNITGNIKYADLNLGKEVYYLKKNKELIIIKNILQNEEPEITVENNMIIKNILIEGKPVYNRQPEIFIPYTSPEKYKVFINEKLLDIKEGFNKINLDNPGYYDIKICKGIKNTKETRIIRKEKEYFYFKDLNILFYNEDGDKEYLFSHRDKKPIGNYNFDTKGISKVVYKGKEIEKYGNTYDIFIDNGFNKDFSFQMTSEDREYNAIGKMRVLEWSLDGENYFPEYNKNILYEDIKDKVLTIKIDNLVGDIIFYGNDKPIGKNKIEFKYCQEELENMGENVRIKVEFRLSSDKYSPICIESLFKLRFNSKVKSISYKNYSKILDVKVRGKIKDMILQIKTLSEEIVYQNSNLELDNKIILDLKGLHKIKIFIKDESFNFFDENDKTILYEEFFEF